MLVSFVFLPDLVEGNVGFDNGADVS